MQAEVCRRLEEYTRRLSTEKNRRAARVSATFHQQITPQTLTNTGHVYSGRHTIDWSCSTNRPTPATTNKNEYCAHAKSLRRSKENVKMADSAPFSPCSRHGQQLTTEMDTKNTHVHITNKNPGEILHLDSIFSCCIFSPPDKIHAETSKAHCYCCVLCHLTCSSPSRAKNKHKKYLHGRGNPLP